MIFLFINILKLITMIYLDKLQVKNRTFYSVKYMLEDVVQVHYIHDFKDAAEDNAKALSSKYKCELFSSLPKKKSKKA